MALDWRVEARAVWIRAWWDEDTYWQRSRGRRTYRSEVSLRRARRMAERVFIPQASIQSARRLWIHLDDEDGSGSSWDNVVRWLDGD